MDSNGHRIHPSIVSSDKSAFRPIQHEKNSEKFHAASERLAQEQSSQSPTKRVRRRSFSDSEVSLNGLDGQDWPFVPEKLLLTKIVFRIEKEKRRVIQPSYRFDNDSLIPVLVMGIRRIVESSIMRLISRSCI